MRAPPRADRADGAGGSQIRKLENTLLSPRASSLSRRPGKKINQDSPEIKALVLNSALSGPKMNARTTLQIKKRLLEHVHGGKLPLKAAVLAGRMGSANYDE